MRTDTDRLDWLQRQLCDTRVNPWRIGDVFLFGSGSCTGIALYPSRERQQHLDKDLRGAIDEWMDASEELGMSDAPVNVEPVSGDAEATTP